MNADKSVQVRDPGEREQEFVLRVWQEKQVGIGESAII